MSTWQVILKVKRFAELRSGVLDPADFGQSHSQMIVKGRVPGFKLDGFLELFDCPIHFVLIEKRYALLDVACGGRRGCFLRNCRPRSCKQYTDPCTDQK